MLQSKTQRCAINVEVGREGEMKVRRTSHPKHICVIGGGPAGMEAARTLALRDHWVTLIEKKKELGGLLQYASVPDFKAELRSFMNYLRTQVKKSKIEILYDRTASIELVKEIGPDSVVLATGSSISKQEIPDTQRPFVANALELLSGEFQAKEKVVVVGGAAMGCEVALHIASSGRKVTIVEVLDEIAMDLESRCRLALLELLREKRVEILSSWKLERIEEGKVLLMGRESQRLEVTTESVILAFGLKSNQELLKPLKDHFTEVYTIGDCVEPRKIYQAIHEGGFVGRAI
jgi:pyruvate/2-oxoglutarate dehydrogenase complex dihydrolipoamide dehydrogenase (E3) component